MKKVYIQPLTERLMALPLGTILSGSGDTEGEFTVSPVKPNPAAPSRESKVRVF